MSTLKITTYPKTILRDVSTTVQFPLTEEQKTLISDMLDTMYWSNGAGLGANQVGRREAIFVLGTQIEDTNNPTICINPFVVELSREIILAEEGCLSFPGVTAKVKRAKTVTIRAQDIEGKWFDLFGEDYLARVIQHEMDHLLGKLFIDHLGYATRTFVLKQLSKYNKKLRSLARKVARININEEQKD